MHDVSRFTHNDVFVTKPGQEVLSLWNFAKKLAAKNIAFRTKSKQTSFSVSPHDVFLPSPITIDQLLCCIGDLVHLCKYFGACQSLWLGLDLQQSVSSTCSARISFFKSNSADLLTTKAQPLQK